MNRILVFGNSGSGKTTLANRYAECLGLEHFDLDTIAWESPGVRKSLSGSLRDLEAFMAAQDRWVIEGCYGSLLKEASRRADGLVFLNPGVEVCLENCRKRPWEPHKYDTSDEQNRNLQMLLSWVAEYETRTDEFSLAAHRKIFDSFRRTKRELTSNAEARDYLAESA
jgi:adenylate kinase family enzyme